MMSTPFLCLRFKFMHMQSDLINSAYFENLSVITNHGWYYGFLYVQRAAENIGME